MAVANRGENSISLIDTASEDVIKLLLEEGTEPVYIGEPTMADEIWVGDRAGNRLLIYDALRMRKVQEIPVREGLFHMWQHPDLGQYWVVCDIAKELTVISLESKEVLAHVPIPDDLAADFKPHDVTLTSSHAVVSLIAEDRDSQVGWVIQFDGTTFEETNRLQVLADPHLHHRGWNESDLYVATHGGTVYRVDVNTFEVKAELSVPGAHGIWSNESEEQLYVANIRSEGPDALYVINLDTFEFVDSGPFDLPAAFPHNLQTSIDGHKLFITHSANTFAQTSNVVSVLDLDQDGIPTRVDRIIETGPTPFGIMLIRDPWRPHWSNIRPLCPPSQKGCLFNLPKLTQSAAR